MSAKINQRVGPDMIPKNIFSLKDKNNRFKKQFKTAFTRIRIELALLGIRTENADRDPDSGARKETKISK